LAQAAQPHPLTRLSDSSFLVLALGLAPAALESFACVLRDSLAGEPFLLRDNEPLRLHGAVGYTVLPQHFADSSSALEAVEHAAMLARRHPGDIAAHVPSETDEQLLAATFDEARPELAFQPIVTVAGHGMAQYQVLLRLRRNDGSLIAAAQVIPEAERTGRIIKLDREVMTLALDRLAQSRIAGSALRLFVSQSPRSLAGNGTVDLLLQAIAAR
jgi:predicted signal transduction protein with EAL and GGDEF domain